MDSRQKKGASSLKNLTEIDLISGDKTNWKLLFIPMQNGQQNPYPQEFLS